MLGALSWFLLRGARSSVLRFVFRVGGEDSPDLPPGGQLLQVSWRKQVAEVTLAGRGGPASSAVLRAVSSPSSCWLSSLRG